MSKFSTSLPLNLDELTDLLPKRSFFHGITVNGVLFSAEALKAKPLEVALVWENDKLETGATFDFPFPMENLSKRKLPKGVRDASKPMPATLTPPVNQNASESQPAPLKPAPVYLTEAEYTEAIAKGVAVEFMGIESVWKPVDPKNHTFMGGYYYRVVDKDRQEA